MINLYDFLNATHGQLFGEPVAHLFTDFCLDVERVTATSLFVALRTEQGDTHRYIREAIHRGAAGVICAAPPACDTTGVTVIMVRDPQTALIEWARTVLATAPARIIAVTGSTGRSTTAAAIAEVLATQYHVHLGDINTPGLLAIPFSLAGLRPNHDFLVLKVDLNEVGAVQALFEGVLPDVVVINHIDCLHTVGFISCEQYIAQLGELLSRLLPDGLAVLNYDDERVIDLARYSAGDVRTHGIDLFGADLMAFNVVSDTTRTGFDIRAQQDKLVGRWSPLLGRTHLYSALAALNVGDHFGIYLEKGLLALRDMQPLPGRLAPLPGPGGCAVIDDSYSASLLSTFESLEWLRAVRYNHRVVVVLGDLDDMGAQSQIGHRSVGGRVASVADVLVAKGRHAAMVAQAALDQGMDASQVHITHSAIDAAAVIDAYALSADDLVLVKGGRASRMEQVVQHLVADYDALPVLNGRLPQTVDRPLHPSWVEVDLQQLGRNVELLRAQLSPHVSYCAVVKANAYGHGAVAVARTVLQHGADLLAVASLTEALELREAGIQAPILVLTHVPEQGLRQAIHARLTLTVFELEQIRQYDRVARASGQCMRVHLKVDTGMGRLGVLADEALLLLRYLAKLDALELEGIYTHYSVADADPVYTDEQTEAFRVIVRAARASGFNLRYVHASNSAAMLRSPDYHFDMVRVGLAMYGLHSSPELPLPDGIKPPLTWKTTVLQVKTLPAGHPVGYGNTYITPDMERVAILPVGYADGLRRAPQTWQYALIHGQMAPLRGRVSMEKTVVSVNHIAQVQPGDEVVLLGRQGDAQISAEQVAEWLGTINYEVVTNLIRHLPRQQ